jgi:hypothetical protein
VIGLAGVLPYLGTSLATVTCAYEIGHATAGYGYFMSAKTAETLLHILEPVQIGYGAVVSMPRNDRHSKQPNSGRRYSLSSVRSIGVWNGPVMGASKVIDDTPLE